MSKCSLEGPGGTLDDDLSVVSLSAADNKQDDEEEVVSLTDVVIENVTDNQDQSLFIDPFRLSKSQNLNIAEVMEDATKQDEEKQNSDQHISHLSLERIRQESSS